MSNRNTDRNLIVGILALQMGLCTDMQLLTAMKQWIFRKDTPLEDILREQSVINKQQQDFLRSLAEQHIALHSDDPAKSLGSLTISASIKDQLARVDDSEITFSLQSARETSDTPDPYSTTRIDTGNQRRSERFVILRPHAEGGLGQVSIAKDYEIHREVALKKIKPKYVNDEQSRNRFLIEAEVTGQLEHPGIVPVYSLGNSPDGTPFYVMKFIRGDSLKDAIERLHDKSNSMASHERRLILRKLLKRFIDVCNAIEYAHSRGVLHRDLKPGNVMLGKYGETLVVDWGLAKTGTKGDRDETATEATVVPQSGDTSSLTQQGLVIGTIAYMGPEQAEGRIEDLGPHSDVYCLGATLFAILTGVAPIPKASSAEMLKKVIDGDIRWPSELNPSVPRALDAICRKAMSKAREQRYQSAARLAEEIELWLADEPVSAYREPILDRALRFVRKHQTLVASIVAVLIPTVIGLAVINSYVQTKNRQLQIAENEANERRIEAEKQKQRAEKSLDATRALAFNLVNLAEESLSKPRIDGQVIVGLRTDLTERAFAQFQTLYTENPDHPEVRIEFIRVAKISAVLQRYLNKKDVALQRLGLCVEALSEIAESEVRLTILDLTAETYREFGTTLKSMDQVQEAATAFDKARTAIQQALSKEPANTRFRRTLAVIELEEAALYAEQLEYETAMARLETSGQVLQELASGEEPLSTDSTLSLLNAARKILITKQMQNYEAAATHSKAAIELYGQLQEKVKSDVASQIALSRMHFWTAESILDAGGTDAQKAIEEAAKHTAEAIRISRAMIEQTPHRSTRYSMAESLLVQSRVDRLQGNLETAEKNALEAAEIFEVIRKEEENAEVLSKLADTHVELEAIKKAAGDIPAAETHHQTALTYQTQATHRSPTSKWHQEKLRKLGR